MSIEDLNKIHKSICFESEADQHLARLAIVSSAEPWTTKCFRKGRNFPAFSLNVIKRSKSTDMESRSGNFVNNAAKSVLNCLKEVNFN